MYCVLFVIFGVNTGLLSGILDPPSHLIPSELKIFYQVQWTCLGAVSHCLCLTLCISNSIRKETQGTVTGHTISAKLLLNLVARRQEPTHEVLIRGCTNIVLSSMLVKYWHSLCTG